MQSRTVQGGSSYLSQSELPVTVRIGKAGPRGESGGGLAKCGTQEFKNLAMEKPTN